MKHKDKEALKNAFGIPEPLEADTFFERPEFAEVKEKRRRALLFHRIPAALRYGTIAVAAAAVIGVWGGFRNWAKDDKFPANEITATEETNTAEAATGSEDTTSTAPEGNGVMETLTLEWQSYTGTKTARFKIRSGNPSTEELNGLVNRCFK